MDLENKVAIVLGAPTPDASTPGGMGEAMARRVGGKNATPVSA